jgi:hypothetical protein
MIRTSPTNPPAPAKASKDDLEWLDKELAKGKLSADEAAEYALLKARKEARKVWMRGYMRDWRIMDKARKAAEKEAGNATD